VSRFRRNPFDWVVAGATAFLGIGAIVAAFQMGVGSAAAPGPGAWPLVIGVALLALDVWFVLRPAEATAEPASPPSRWAKLAIAIVSLFGYVLLLDPLGYLVATALLLVVQLRWVESRSWMISVVTAVVAAGVSFLAFAYWLKVALPPGIIPLGGA